MLPTLTFTGADGSIDPRELVTLSQQYPFIEWGLNFSKTKGGTPRYPSVHWLRVLKSEMVKQPKPIALSAHLGGLWAHELLTGFSQPEDYLGEFWNLFDRIQVNTDEIPDNYNERCLKAFRRNAEKEFILPDLYPQSTLIPFLVSRVANVAVIYPIGELHTPLPYRIPIGRNRCGFMGGLTPRNLLAQLGRIETTVKRGEYWIDLETTIRVERGNRFSAEAVKACIELFASISTEQTCNKDE